MCLRCGHRTYAIDYYAKPGAGGPRWQDQHPVYSDEQLSTPPPGCREQTENGTGQCIQVRSYTKRWSVKVFHLRTHSVVNLHRNSGLKRRNTPQRCGAKPHFRPLLSTTCRLQSTFTSAFRLSTSLVRPGCSRVLWLQLLLGVETLQFVSAR